jgi:hypothetical protein
MARIMNRKLRYSRQAPILQRNKQAKAIDFWRVHMTTATITQAQDKGLRHQFAALASDMLAFCHQLYAAYGGSPRPTRREEKKMTPAQLNALADQFEAYSPSLSAEIRNLVTRG